MLFRASSGKPSSITESCIFPVLTVEVSWTVRTTWEQTPRLQRTLSSITFFIFKNSLRRTKLTFIGDFWTGDRNYIIIILGYNDVFYIAAAPVLMSLTTAEHQGATWAWDVRLCTAPWVITSLGPPWAPRSSTYTTSAWRRSEPSSSLTGTVSQSGTTRTRQASS